MLVLRMNQNVIEALNLKHWIKNEARSFCSTRSSSSYAILLSHDGERDNSIFAYVCLYDYALGLPLRCNGIT